MAAPEKIRPKDLSEETNASLSDFYVFDNGNEVRKITLENALKLTATGGTARRKISDRFADIINVKDFGATGDGITDDTAAIQSALNRAAQLPNSAYAVVISFPRGVYLISSTLTVASPSRVVLRGDGCASGSATASVIKTTNANADIIDVSTGAVNVFSMQHLQLQGPGKGTGTGRGVIVGNSTVTMYDSFIFNCWFTQIPSWGVYLKRAQNFKVHQCAFDGAGGGIWLDNNSVSDVDYVDNSGLNCFEGNTFYACDTGLKIEFAYAARIVNNLFQFCGTASDTNGALVISRGVASETRDILIGVNQFNRGIRHDIYLQGCGTGSPGLHQGVNSVTITGNTSDFAVGSFLRANGCGQIDCFGNSVNDCSTNAITYAAFCLINGSDKSTFFGNSVTVNGAYGPTYGLFIDSTCSNPMLGHNRWYGRTADLRIDCALEGNSDIQGTALAINAGEVLGATDLPTRFRCGVHGTSGLVAAACGDLRQDTNGKLTYFGYDFGIDAGFVYAYDFNTSAYKKLSFNGGNLVVETSGNTTVAHQLGVGTNVPDASALLDMVSSSKGFSPPKMTKAQRNAIASPSAIIIYQTDGTPGFRFYENGAWRDNSGAPDP